MLKRKNRLPSSDLFKNVFLKGNKVGNRCFVLIYLKNDLSYSRVGIIVSKKVSKLATVRNKIKRRIRNCIRELLPYLTNNWDLVIVAKKPILDEPFSALKEDLKVIFKKII